MVNSFFTVYYSYCLAKMQSKSQIYDLSQSHQVQSHILRQPPEASQLGGFTVTAEMCCFIGTDVFLLWVDFPTMHCVMVAIFTWKVDKNVKLAAARCKATL